jgi:hypothetical protein
MQDSSKPVRKRAAIFAQNEFFLHKLLHIPEKSVNFAPELGSIMSRKK